MGCLEFSPLLSAFLLQELTEGRVQNRPHPLGHQEASSENCIAGPRRPGCRGPAALSSGTRPISKSAQCQRNLTKLMVSKTCTSPMEALPGYAR